MNIREYILSKHETTIKTFFFVINMFKTSIQPDGTINCTEKDKEKQNQSFSKGRGNF